METLKTFVSKYVDLPDDELRHLEELLQPLSIKKMNHIFVSDSYVKDLYFLESGTFRVYLIKEGIDYTTKFLFGPTFYTDLFSIRKHLPTILNVQALTDCKCYKVNFAKIEAAKDKSPNIRRLFLKFYEEIYIEGVKRQVSFIMDPQFKRYKDLLKDNPDIIDDIPLQYIASYLGVKPETLSRIRKKLERL